MSEITQSNDVAEDVDIDVTTDPGIKLTPAAAALQSLPAAPATAPHPLSPEQVQELIAVLEREAKVLGNDAAGARLHHEMGLLWEGPLKNARNAAVCYQNAYRLNPKFVANIRAARRLFAEVGNWQMVAQLVDAEASAIEAEPERVALMLEKARILEDRLGKADDALALLQQCRQRWPQDVSVLQAIEAALEPRHDLSALREIRVAIAGLMQDPALAAQYLVAAARLCEGALGQSSEAAELYRRAFALRREDLTVLSAVERSAERKGDREELLASLRAQAEKAGAGGAPIWYRISRVYEQMSQPEKALEALLAGRKIAPHDPVILDELARTLESAGRWQELSEVLQARIAKLTDTHERVGLNLRLGALFETVLGNDDAAIECYKTVLSIAPTNLAAVSGVGKLASRKKDWAGLLAVHDLELAGTEDPRQKVARQYKAAELLETRLERLDEAVTRYRQCLETQPGYLPAQKALVRIYERMDRWDDLVSLYEEDAKHTSDRDQLIAILSRIANIHEERRKDLPAAAATFKRILEIVPEHLPTIRALAHACEKAGMWEELLKTNELEAGLAGDSRQVISLLHTNAEILEDQLKRKDDAIAAYKKALSLSANYLPALKALGRLYAQAGRWDELVDMNRQEAEITANPEAAAGLIFKVGELLEEKLSRLDDAIAAYQEVLTLSPSHFPALRALSRIYRAQRNWESLVEVLRAEAAARTDSAEKANTLFRVAALWEDELGRTDLAIETYKSVLELVPDHGPAFSALERLYTADGNFKELAALLERELKIALPAEVHTAAYEKLAALYVDRFQDAARAEQCYEAVLQLSPGHVGALKGLEILRAGDRVRRAEIRARLAGAVTDKRAAVALRLSAAADRELLGQVPLDDLRQAAAQDADDPRVVAEYVRVLRKVEDHEALVIWYERRLSAQLTPDVKLSLFLRLGEVCEWNLGRDDKALASYRAATELDPTCLCALRGQRRILSRAGNHGEAYKLLLAEAQISHDPALAQGLLLEAGNLAEQQLRNGELARAAYQAVLARDPLEPRAGERMEALLAASGGAKEIAELHLKKGAGREAAHDQAAAAEEFLAAAKTFATQLNDGPRAFEVLEHALRNVPTHPAALQLKGDLCLAAGRHADAAQAYLHRLEQGGEPGELAALHYRLGMLLQDHLNEAARATAHLQTAYAADPSNVDALERLGAIHLAAGNWGGAADALRRLIETTKDKLKLSKHLVAFAHVADVGLGDPKTAVASYKKALEMVPGDSGVLDKLAALYERLGNLSDLSTALEQQAFNSAADGDKPRAVSLRIRAAELFQRQNDLQKAVQNYRFAVELAPDQVAPRAALADLMSKAGSMPAAAIEEHRAVLRLDPVRLESYHSLFRMWAASRQLDKAICAAHVLAFVKALTEAETASFTDARSRAPAETAEILTDEEIDGALQHPAARGPLADVMRIIGDQLHKVFEPGLDDLGIGKGDRLKADHPQFKLAKSLCTVFRVEKVEVYQAKVGAHITLENTDPLAMIVGVDVVRRYQAREQRFLFARAAYQLRNKMPIAYKLDTARLTDLLGNAVRVVAPNFNRLGKPDAEMTKRLKKAMSGKAIKALEGVVGELERAKTLDVNAWLQASAWSADRAGLLLSGDIAATLLVRLKEDVATANQRMDTTEQLVATVRRRRDLYELLAFVTSDDFFKLRTRLRLSQ
ncbi:MAG: Adventurous gliding motility protein K [Myxococcales bacterium]